MFPAPFAFFGISIYPFGIIAALSIFLGYWVARREFLRFNFSADILPDLAFGILIPAFLGARLLFIILNWNDYLASPGQIVRFWEGGLVLYGGLLGGLTGGFLFCRRRKLSFSKFSDPVALGLAFGLAFSHLGCLLAGCCYGTPTALPWGITFTHPLSLAQPLDVCLHPTQMYAFLIGMAIYLILRLIRNRKTFDGQVLLSYLMMTSAARIFLEFFRADPPPFTALLASFIFLFSAVQYVKLKTKNWRNLMQKSVWKFTTLLLIGALFAACGIVKTQKISRGLDISASDVNDIIKGKTTEKEIVKLFGPPTKIRDTADGQEYFYEYTKAGGPQWNLLISVGGDTVTKTLLVWFDKNGVVSDYAYKAS